MKTKTTISDVKFEDLANLLSGAFYDVFRVDYITRFNKLKKGDFFEDRLANILLGGGAIGVIDNFAEGEVYGSIKEHTEYEDGAILYEVTLSNIIDGIEKALNGTEWQRRCAMDLVGESEHFDANEAQTLMQMIVFGEEIYG